jgi:hypothetical protein
MENGIGKICLDNKIVEITTTCLPGTTLPARQKPASLVLAIGARQNEVSPPRLWRQQWQVPSVQI